MERTLVFLKPDAVMRGIVGEILSRFERRGFLICGLKLLQLSEEQVRHHYGAHEGKDFYEPLVQYVLSGPIVAMVLEGKNAVAVVRDMMGRTFGSDSPAGTIRGDFALSNRFNLVHGSDSAEAAEQEVCTFFDQGELVEYPRDKTRWTYDWNGEEPV
jgi:nucleoside-diphosphate kinase